MKIQIELETILSIMNILIQTKETPDDPLLHPLIDFAWKKGMQEINANGVYINYQ